MSIESIIGNLYHPTWRELLATGILFLLAVIFAAKKKGWSKAQRILFPILTIYGCAVLGITIFNRLPYDSVKYHFDIFWSYRKAAGNRGLLWQIVLNYMLLLPFGVLGSFYLKRSNVILWGLLISASIEITQFVMRRGVFEVDDIIGNTLGALIGVGVYSLGKAIRKRSGRKA